MCARFLVAVGLLSTAALGEEPVSAARPTVDLGVGFRAFTRTFGNTDGAATVLGYAGSAGGVAVDASYFPGAFATKSLAGDLGLFGEGQFSLGLTSEHGTDHFATSATTLRGGLALRVPSGRHTVLFHAGVESRAFRVASTSAEGRSRPLLPDVGYLGPRAGLGYRVVLTAPLSLELKAGFTWAVGRGELASVAYFPSSSAFALDAQVAVSFAIVSSIQLRAFGDFSRYFISLDASHGAADQSFGGGLALAVNL